MIGALFTSPPGPIDGGLAVRPFISEDSHGFELFDPDTGDIAAIIHDGADRGDGEAQAAAEILAAAPVMLTLLLEALAINRAEFEDDTAINGADLVDDIAAWRRKVIRALHMGLPSAPVVSEPT
jgi:hypothetical protein